MVCEQVVTIRHHLFAHGVGKYLEQVGPERAYLSKILAHADIPDGWVGLSAPPTLRNIRTGWYLGWAFSPAQDTSPCSSVK